MNDTDAQLLQQIACRRSSDAFDTLAEHWREPLRRYLVGLTGGDLASTEDLLQETLLRVWTQATSFDGRGEPRAWAFRIAGNLASNARRSRTRRREEHPNADVLDGFAADLPLPEEAALQAESNRRIRRAIDALDEDRRELIRLVYDEDWPLADVAQAFSIPTGTVKSRLYHTRRELARTLKKEETE